MLDLRSKADFQRLVDEGLEESLALDYKASPSLKRDGEGPGELCKDVSALANSAGGQLVYGIEEDKVTKKPSRVDDGVADAKITREWIEQVLNSRVQPRISGIQTTRIDMGNGKFGYVITVPQSRTGPHQAPDQKYYKRFDLQSVAMHDYEIKDIMRRATTPDLFCELSFDAKQTTKMVDASTRDGVTETIILHFAIKNRSSTPAYHVIAEVALDYDLFIPYSLPGGLIGIGERDEPPGPKVRLYRRALNSPPLMPIFREGDVHEHSAGIAIAIPRSHLDSSIFWIEVSLKAPGFSTVEKWTLRTSHGTLKLFPPGHPMNR